MKYIQSMEWTKKTRNIALILELNLRTENIFCVESIGSKSRRTIARIHTFGKAIQIGAELKPVYVIELITEIFGKQPEQEKIKTIIHELLHVPRAFGGGFKGHRKYANKRNVDALYEKLIESRQTFLL
ncbi:MAG: putative metallopeptidase [Candidatus Diapherotrites archaeon]